MIKVADCIMGSGKSQAAIAYMNEHPEKKFIYITPYLDEVARVKKSCPNVNFAEPSDKLPQFNFSKTEHSAFLISVGRNIASTHALFRQYTPSMIEEIGFHGYTLIVDEALEVMSEAKYQASDVNILERAGYIQRNENGLYESTGHEYDNGRFRDLLRTIESNNLLEIKSDRGTSKRFYWTIPFPVLSAFSDVIILTYLFESQDLSYYLELNGATYVRLYVKKCEDGQYRFFDSPQSAPEYVKHIKEKVHVFECEEGREKYFTPFEKVHDVSESFVKTNVDGVTKLKSRIRSYLTYVFSDIPGDKIMWGSYSAGKKKLGGRGYMRKFVPFNSKATNKYKDRQVLVYAANVFQNPTKANYLGQVRDGGYDNDGYALSTMVQWIWRSAIRDGHEIWIYIPSKRMRDLLIKWMDDLQASVVV